MACYLPTIKPHADFKGIDMKPYEKREFDTLVTLANANNEQFRYQASNAYTAYTRPDRRLLRRVRPAAEFYNRYQDVYQPTIRELGRKKPHDAMTTTIAKGLLVGDSVAADIVKNLYDNRYETLMQETIASLPHRSRLHAARILHMPTQQIESLLYHYHQAMLYTDVSHHLRIAVDDPVASLFSRVPSLWRIQRNRRKTVRIEKKRIATIDHELQKIDAQKGDLLRRIVSNQLELVTLLGLRNEFAKKATGSSRQQLEKFEKTTKKFMNQQIDAYMLDHPDANLRNIAHKKRTIEQLLQDIIALNNVERNQLLLTFSDYSRLYNERIALVDAQQARDEYINR